LRFALVAEGILIHFSSGAHASHADFTINNKTDYQIDEAYVFRVDTKPSRSLGQTEASHAIGRRIDFVTER
jgi:hypothetical protein